MELKKAVRKQIPLKVGLAGPSGSGKTYSALLMAKGLVGNWNEVAVIDSEHGSADFYSHLGDYNTLTLEAPFTPERYIEAITTCEKAGVKAIIIDSITHEWSGTGGILELQEQLGGRYQDWSKVKPRHKKFIEKILSSKCHVITTVRSKQDYSMDIVDGKTKVTKQGTKQITEDGFEYELSVSFELNQNHLAMAGKDRTGLFMNQPEFVISEETGRKLLDWSNSGEKEKVISAKQSKIISDLIKKKGADETKFLDYFRVASVKELTVSKFTEAEKLLLDKPDKKA